MSESPRGTILELAGVSVPGRLEKVSLAVPVGRKIGLVGPNGAGKSTLLQVAAGLIPASAGAILWNGRSPSKIPALERGRCAAWVPQDAHFEFGFTVRSVVAQGRFAHGDDERGVQEALRRFELEALASRPVNRLSGGEKQRVLLARALVTGAPLQLWDEPLAQLDPRHELQVLRLASDLAAAGTTLLFSLHNLRAAGALDLLAVVHRGRLLAFGPPAEVLRPDLLLEVFGVRARTAEEIVFELPPRTEA
ncbi:MAG: ABC transporter ATP-binding protein [Opitutaceae bacterium]